MHAIEVYINNQKITSAGVPGHGQLAALMTSGNCCDTPSEDISEDNKARCSYISVFGAHPGARTNRLYWVDREPLEVGDEIKICVVESDSVDAPLKQEQTPPKDRMQYESVKELYFELREKFENQ